MSFSADEMNLMGSTNNHWGVCGFTSTFYSMYELNRGKRALVIGAGIATKVLAEIKTYLMLLKADGNIGLLNEIETFTKSFGKVGKADFGSFTIDAYIALINKAVSRTEAEIKGDANYSLAITARPFLDTLVGTRDAGFLAADRRQCEVTVTKRIQRARRSCDRKLHVS